MKKLSLVFAVVSSFFFNHSARAADLDLAGLGDDAAAAVIVSRWLSDIGYAAKLPAGEKQISIDDDSKFDVIPKVTVSGVDRLIFYKLFKGKPSNARSAELKEIVSEINNRYNVCSAYVDADGDLQMRFIIVFDDKITPKLFRLSMAHFKTASAKIIADYRQRFKPYYE